MDNPAKEQIVRSTISPPEHVKYVYRSDDSLLCRNITVHSREELQRLKDIGATKFVLHKEETAPEDENPAAEVSLHAEEIDAIQENPDDLKSTIQTNRRQYNQTISLMKDVFSDLQNDVFSEKKLNRVTESLKGFIASTQKNPAGVGALTQLKTYDDCTYQHSLNVCLLAMLYGNFRNFDSREVLELGLGALFHDIGKTDLPTELIQSPDRLSPEQREQIENHPETGHETLEKLDMSFEIQRVALEHHERPDGSGYPKGKRSIHLYSRITAVCDMYEALTARRAYKEPIHPLQAFTILKKEFIQYTETRKVISGLLHALGLFPVGSYVELNSGERGFVSKNHREDLRRPTVVITSGRNGTVLSEPYPVDLLKAAKRKYGIRREIYDDSTYIEVVLPIRDHPMEESAVTELLEEYS